MIVVDASASLEVLQRTPAAAAAVPLSTDNARAHLKGEPSAGDQGSPTVNDRPQRRQQAHAQASTFSDLRS